MKTKREIAGVLWLGALVTQSVYAAPYTPKKVSAERRAIMNAVRPQLGDGRHTPVITPYHFKVERGWAYILGGFDYAGGSKPGGQFAEGSGTNFSVLLRRENRKWRVKRFVYNGDVQEPKFIKAFPQAPRAIFKTN